MKKLLPKLPAPLRKRIVRSRVRFDPYGVDDVTFRIATDDREVEAAHRLVHDCYVDRGLIDPCPTGMRRTKYHDNPGSAVMVGVKDGEVIATGSVYTDVGAGLPSDALLPDALDALRARGRVLSEVGNLATHPAHRTGNQTLPLHMNKVVFRYAAEIARADDLVIAVNPRHFWVYEDIILFERLSGTLDYDYVKGNPAIVARLNLNTVARRMAAVYPHKPTDKNAHYFYFVHQHENIHLPTTNPVTPAPSRVARVKRATEALRAERERALSSVPVSQAA